MLVSIFIPTKDRRSQLQAAIDSVRTQTYSEWEIIVVNDGSSDDTKSYLEQLVAAEPRIRAIHHEHSVGAPRSRNEAIRLARGEWLTGLDDDDQFKPLRLEFLLRYAVLLERSDTPYSAVFTQAELILPHGKTISRRRASVHLEDEFVGNAVGNELFARRQNFIDIGLYDESLPAWQDLDLAMRMVDKFGPARLIDAPLFVFADDDRPDRISRKKKTQILAAYRIVRAKWPNVNKLLRQKLYLQVLSAYYGFPLEFADLWRYFSMGFSVASVLSLLQTLRRRRQRRQQSQ